MKFSHVLVSGGFIALATAAALYLNIISPLALFLLVGIPSLAVGIFYFRDYIVPEESMSGIKSNSNPSTGSHYDTAIEPDEAWNFVNKRIKELEEDGFTPYRKINMDKTDRKRNQKIHQDTIRASIDSKETRLTLLMGRPKNPRAKELIAYVVDLKVPAIEKYSGDLVTPEERSDPFDSKYGFHIKKGINSEDVKDDDSGAPVEINQEVR